MIKQSINFSGHTTDVYLQKYEDDLIISIPDLAFSMKVSTELSTSDIEQEVMLQLFSFMDEAECRTLASEISIAIGKI